jgi:hypothetical protein
MSDVDEALKIAEDFVQEQHDINDRRSDLEGGAHPQACRCAAASDASG